MPGPDDDDNGEASPTSSGSTASSEMNIVMSYISNVEKMVSKIYQASDSPQQWKNFVKLMLIGVGLIFSVLSFVISMVLTKKVADFAQLLYNFTLPIDFSSLLSSTYYSQYPTPPTP